MSDYYDKDGTPIGMWEWAVKLEDRAYKRVAFDVVGGVEVSPVWLGLNHRVTAGPPLIFETMVFGGPRDQDQFRYSTLAEALEGHRRVVEREWTDGAA